MKRPLSCSTGGRSAAANLAGAASRADLLHSARWHRAPSGAVRLAPRLAVLSILFQAIVSAVPFWQDQATAITQCPPIVLSPLTLPDAYFQISYSQRITAVGGRAPYDFSLAANALPNGLALSPRTGTISGRVNSYSSQDPPFTFLIRVTDANGCSVQRAFTITVRSCPTIPVGFIEPAFDASSGGGAGALPVPLPDALVGDAFARQLSSSGGAPPYRYALEHGFVLPPELELSSTGGVSGTLTTPGGSLFEIRSTDANGCFGIGVFSLIVRCPAIGIEPKLLSGQAGVAFQERLTATGGNAPYTFSVDPRSPLPPGLTLSSGGVLRGTPTRPDTYAFEVIATDVYRCANPRRITLTIDPAPTQTLTPTATPTPSSTITPTSSYTPTRTPTASATTSVSATPTRTASPTSTPTEESVAPTATYTLSPDGPTPTAATSTATPTSTGSPTISPTLSPDGPTATPTTSTATPTSTIAVAVTPTLPPDGPTATATTSPPSPTSTASNTPSPTPSPTPTPTAPLAFEPCTGDCDGSGEVSIAELVEGVHVVLGGSAVSCSALEVDDGAIVDLGSLILGIGNALHGCP